VAVAMRWREPEVLRRNLRSGKENYMRDRGRAKEETPSVDTVAVYRIEGMAFESRQRRQGL